MKKVKEIMQERAEQRECKVKKIDSNLSYPTYGRGVDPDQRMDTYMINQSLCQEHHSPSRKVRMNQSPSPTRKEKQKKPKVCSPSR